MFHGTSDNVIPIGTAREGTKALDEEPRYQAYSYRNP
jgi:hypothetical protein